MSVWRCLAGWVAALVVAVAVPVQAADTLAGAITTPGWPHDRSEFKPDPAARYGQLANGMRYVLYRNTAKGRSASVRFQIAAGSLQERDDQLGLAHFVEHMAFRGTKRLKDGQIADMLKAEGVDFGSDVNAFTDHETMKFVLDLPSNDIDSIERSLFILREIASNVTFDGSALEHERGVILAEERLRASAASRSADAMIATAYSGGLYPKRKPIGTLDSIRKAPRQALIDYYQTWYRPELAVLVLVGDFDLAAMDQRVRDTFNDWKPARPGPVAIVPYAPVPFEGMRTAVHAEPNLHEGVGAAWFRPYIDLPDTLATRHRGYRKGAAMAVMNQRFARFAEDPSATFIAASVSYDNSRLGGNVTSLWVTPKPGMQRAAYLQALRMINLLKADGVTAAEVAEILATRDAQMDNMVRSYQTRFSSDIAEDILDFIGTDDVFETPQHMRTVWERIKREITAETVNEQIAVLFKAPGILLNRQGEAAPVLDEAGLRAVWDEAAATVAEGPVVEAGAVVWPYTRFGPPAGVVDRSDVKRLDYTRYTLSNGVTVNIKSNPLVKNEIVVSARFVGGYRLFSPSENVSMVQMSFFDLAEGGLGRMSRQQIRQALATKTVGMAYALDEDAATLTGYTTRDSFAAQMQLLMAYATDPGFRPEMFELARTGLDSMYQRIRASPGTTLGYGASAWLAGNDPRYVLPPQEALAQRTPDEITAIFRRTLTGVPVEVTITGDIQDATALEQVRLTFGNLPRVPTKPTFAPDGEVVRLPTDTTPQVYYHGGRVDQYVAMAVFPATDAVSQPADTRGLIVLTQIFNARLDDELRQKLGLAYDGQVYLTASEVMKGFGYIAAEGTIPADKDTVFYDTVVKIARDLASEAVSSSELEQARRPLVQYLSDQNKNNEDWQTILAGLYGDTQLWDYRTERYRKYMAITAEDILRLAKQYLKTDALLRLHTEPAA